LRLAISASLLEALLASDPAPVTLFEPTSGEVTISELLFVFDRNLRTGVETVTFPIQSLGHDCL
jgi:hypothetical protein